MKRLLPFLFFALPLVLFHSLPAQQQSLSLPRNPPIYCSGVAGNCEYPFVYPNMTGIIVCRQCSVGTLTDNLGDVWQKNECTPYDDGDCIWSTHFKVPYLTGHVHITFPPGEGNEAFLMIYDGVWNFDSAQYGTYNDQNSVFSDCTNGGDCPYDWTLPVDADHGDLLISWSNTNAVGLGIPRPGFGFTVEASSGRFAVEDMIAPVRGVYIGSLEWRSLDGSESGGSHWLMGLAEYKKQ